MSKEAKIQAFEAATSIAEDIARGRIAPEDLQRALVDECREAFGFVAGPEDPLWELHVGIARQVLALNGIPADELSQWAAVCALAEAKTQPIGNYLGTAEHVVESLTSDDTDGETVALGESEDHRGASHDVCDASDPVVDGPISDPTKGVIPDARPSVRDVLLAADESVPPSRHPSYLETSTWVGPPGSLP